MYKTCDIYFASFLISMGNKLACTEIVPDNGKDKTVFCFDIPPDKGRGLKNVFFGDKETLNVNANSFISTFKNLKSLCY